MADAQRRTEAVGSLKRPAVVVIVGVGFVVASLSTVPRVTARSAQGRSASSGSTGVKTDLPRIKALLHCDSVVANAKSTDSLISNCDRRASAIDRVGGDSRRILEVHYSIPEFHDEQRLRDGVIPPNPLIPGQTRFGPVVFAYAVPQLMGYQYLHEIESQGHRGALVAYLLVDDSSDSPLPESYQRLRLTKGLNCVWLAHVPGNVNGGWKAYIQPATIQPAAMPDTVCNREAPPPSPLDVHRSTPSTNIDDYPPVVRFGEGTIRARRAGQPLDISYVQPTIIVKCLAGSCEIGPPDFRSAAPPPAAAFASLPHDAPERIEGWYDDQWLSDGSGDYHRPVVRAIVTPRPGAARMTADHFAATPVEAASIYLFADPPAGSTYANWGLRRGLNRLMVRHYGNQWRGTIVPPNGTAGITWVINRTPHFDEAIPGTARFRWSESPTGIWFPCDEACCQGGGGGT